MSSSPSVCSLIRSLQDNDSDALDRLRSATVLAAELSSLGDGVVNDFVDIAREEGHTWAEIGEVLGMTEQAAQQRFRLRWFDRFTGRQGAWWIGFKPSGGSEPPLSRSSWPQPLLSYSCSSSSPPSEVCKNGWSLVYGPAPRSSNGGEAGCWLRSAFGSSCFPSGPISSPTSFRCSRSFRAQPLQTKPSGHFVRLNSR